MNSQAKMNILFYSNKCRDCHTFINLMKNEGLLQYFKTICVDNNLKDIPSCITKVPAIITAEPNQLYLANEVFKWLQGVKYMRQQQINLNEQNKKIIQYNIYKSMQAQAQMGGPSSFISTEMAGISDNFAYTKMDMAQPKSFQEYGKDHQEVILTPPKEDEKLNDYQQKKRMKEIENQRDQQNKQFNDNMKQGQLQAVMKLEREKLINNNKYN